MTARVPEKSLVGSRLDHFQVIAELGRGGMGVVYLADDEKLSRTVALKVLRPELADDETRRARFLREARSAAAVTHPNVAAIYEVGEADGHVYLAMERIEGRPLRAEIDGAPLPNERLVAIARGVAAALARAHDKGVIHRDLKPENVLIGEDGAPKVVDFGLAKLIRNDDPTSGEAETEVQLSQEGAAMGTPAYMSPEQARGVAVDHRTDLFSFGVLLYELATGERPFRGPTSMDVIVAIARDEPTPVRAKNPDVPEGIERAIQRCLAKDPAGRYASAHELVRELEGERARDAAPAPRASGGAADRKSELILLERVKEFWIDGVLAQATGDQERLDLAKDERSAAVDRGFELAAPRLDEDETPIDSGVSMLDYFDRRGRALLVLGEPGAGKTVTLLELAKALVARATVDPAAPLPIVLGLATWRDPKQTLEAWIAAQLRDAYRIPERVGRGWIEADRLALLLDGLDEVAPALVADCVRAINAFRTGHGFVEIAVTSRRSDYEALSTRLKLDAAIQLRSLTPAQIEGYVAAGGSRLDPLGRALADDAELRELAASPLMLNIMGMSYATEVTPGGGSDAGEPDVDRKTALFHRYVDRMLRRREGRLPLSREDTIASLVWLAGAMQTRNETVFMLEDLQPSHLPRGGWRWLYFAVTRVPVALVFAATLTVNDAPFIFRFAVVAATWAVLVALDERLANQPPRPTRTWRAALLDFGLLFVTTGAALTVVFTIQNFVQRHQSPLDAAPSTAAVGFLIALPLAILLAWRRGRLAQGKDVRTVESLRVRGRTLIIWVIVLALAPELGFWFAFRDDAPREVATYDAKTLARERVLLHRAARAALSPDGRTAFVVGTLDRAGRAFDLETGAARRAPVAGPLVPDPSGTLLANFDPEDADANIRVLGAHDLQVIRSIDRPQAANVRERIQGVAFSRSGRVLASAMALSVLADPETGARVATFGGQVVLAGDGRHVIVLPDEGRPILFREDGTRVAELPFDHDDVARTGLNAAIDPGGSWLAVALGDCLYRVDVDKPTERRVVPTPDCREAPVHPEHAEPTPLAFAPRTDLLVVSQSKRLLFLDRSGAVRHEVAAKRADHIVAGDARALALAGSDLAAYDVDGILVGRAKLPEAHAPWSGSDVVLSADGSRVVTACAAPRTGSIALGFGLFGAVVAFALSLEAGVVRQKTRINEGIHRTARRALTIGLGVGTLVGASNYLYGLLLTSESGEILSAVSVAAFVAVVFAASFGGFDLFCHAALRAELARRKELPLRAARFLESGVQLIFLRRVGGGFIFVHRLVLEYFARDAAPKWMKR